MPSASPRRSRDPKCSTSSRAATTSSTIAATCIRRKRRIGLHGNSDYREFERKSCEKGEAVMENNRFTRRNFIKLGAAAGGAAIAGPGLVATAFANRHPHPRPTSLKYLDRNMYRKNTNVIAHFDPGGEREAKMQLMAIGSRRFMFMRGDVIDITDPLK